MRNDLYWVGGPWLRKLAIGSRPRGGDWLEDEVSGWRLAGIDAVLSLLTPDEEDSLDLKKESALVRKRGMSFASFPIPDRQVPSSPTELSATLDKLNAALSSGKNVLIHCRQGTGRTGLVAAYMLVSKGWDFHCDKTPQHHTRSSCSRNHRAAQLDRPLRRDSCGDPYDHLPSPFHYAVPVTKVGQVAQSCS